MHSIKTVVLPLLGFRNAPSFSAHVSVKRLLFFMWPVSTENWHFKRASYLHRSSKKSPFTLKDETFLWFCWVLMCRDRATRSFALFNFSTSCLEATFPDLITSRPSFKRLLAHWLSSLLLSLVFRDFSVSSLEATLIASSVSLSLFLQ